MLQPSIEKNDRKAKILIWTVSIIVFVAVAFLSKYKLIIDLGFNPHLFATANAIINSIVAFLLLGKIVISSPFENDPRRTVPETPRKFSALAII